MTAEPFQTRKTCVDQDEMAWSTFTQNSAGERLLTVKIARDGLRWAPITVLQARLDGLHIALDNCLLPAAGQLPGSHRISTALI